MSIMQKENNMTTENNLLLNFNDEIDASKIEDILLYIKEDLHEHIKLSASSLKQYLACPRSFLYNKILKPKPTHPSYHWGWFGTMVHNSIYYSFADFVDGEWIYKNGDIRSFEDVVDFYNKYFNGNFTEHPVLEQINAYEGISEEEFVFFVDSKNERTNIYNEGINLIESGISLVKKLINLGIKNVEIEKEILFKPKTFNVLGYIDLKFEINGNVYFFDFKTSKSPLKGDQLKEDLQFFLYSLYLKQNYPKKKVSGFLVHLRSRRAFRHILDKNIEEQNLKKIEMIEKEILNRNFPQNFGPLCRYCEFRGYCNIK